MLGLEREWNGSFRWNEEKLLVLLDGMESTILFLPFC